LFLNSEEERAEFLAKEPKAEKFVRKILGSEEFINGIERWCLWLKDVNPAEWRGLPEVSKRVQAVREFRLKSKKAATVRLADIPYLFAEIRQPVSDFLVMPLVSSESRRYVPIGLLSKEFIVNNLVSIVPNARLYEFGVLTSAMHMAWLRQVCGRLESRYRYSNNLVYNNFPFPPEPDAREQFTGATLADLYDPNSMPKPLVDAHRANDEAVDAVYGTRRFKTDLERLEYLFDLYRQHTDPLTRIAEKETRRAKRRRSEVRVRQFRNSRPR
jgi:hypothetical protein